MLRVRTAVLSDLHLGSHGRRDLLRRPAIRDRLLQSISGMDQVVLLGDVLELREAALEDCVEIARPFLEDVAEALGGGRIVIVPGNHDHELAQVVLSRVRRFDLGLEHLHAPGPSDPFGRTVPRLGGTELVVSYPGVWIGPRTYATHGHYLDLHNSVPTLEILALALSARLSGGPPGPGSGPGDYEDPLERAYAPMTSLAQAAKPSRGVAGADFSVRAWQRLTRGDGGGIATRLLADVVFPGAVGAVNRIGLGDFNPNLSGAELRRAGLRAMGEVVRRLGIEAHHVLFGHTHRSGPWPAGLRAADPPDEWRLAGGPRLTNTGTWLYQPVFLSATPGESPYWPGVLAVVEDDEAPALRGLLATLTHEELG
jgi:predicted phosphodiesterase